jgi:hypothetical protein
VKGCLIAFLAVCSTGCRDRILPSGATVVAASPSVASVPSVAPAPSTGSVVSVQKPLPRANSEPGSKVAARVDYRARAGPVLAKGVQLGDGWGCAELHDRSRYCWEAPGRGAGTITAQHVPALDDTRTVPGPDRLCLRDLERVRCFRAPEFLRNPAVLRWSGELANDASAWWLPHVHGPLMDPTPVTHGSWRGCNAGLCWGSTETPPPSSAALKLSADGALVVPRAVADSSALESLQSRSLSGTSMVGDLFGCFRTHRELLCIGASRDGFFGRREECPPELLGAWPTLHGTVPAPNARCSRKPVPVRPGQTFGNIDSASPRGLCFEELPTVEGATKAQYCFGAHRLPKERFEEVAVGLGDEASACGVDAEGQVYCWGAGYTDPGRAPRRVEFAPPTYSAVVSGARGPFHPRCDLHRNCARAAQPLPVCASGASLISPTTQFGNGGPDEGERIAVRGELVLAGFATPFVAISCEGGVGDFCCPSAAAPIAVRDMSTQLILDGFKCTGDLSRMCCNTRPFGQTVVAEGRLTFRRWVEGLGEAWTLSEPKLCEVREDL